MISSRMLCSQALSLLIFSMISLNAYAFEKGVSERTDKRLTIIHRLMAEQEYDEASSRLDSLAAHVIKRKHDNAYVQQTYGYLYISLNKFEEAINAFKKSIASNVMPSQVQNAMRLSLVKLYANENQFEQAAALFEQWYQSIKSPSAVGLALGGGVYSELAKYDEAIKYLKRAIKQSKNPREYWYQLLISLYLKKKYYQQAENILKTLVHLKPRNKDYWIQLSRIYQVINKQGMALSTYYLAYENGLITSESDIIHLARLFMAEDLPYKAASVLKNSIANNVFDPSINAHELLYRAYVRANDFESAIVTLEKSYLLFGTVSTKIKLGHLYMEIEKWEQAKNSFTEAIKLEGDNSTGKAYFLAGISSYELKLYAEAVSLFQHAAKSFDYRDKAMQWIKYINN